MLNFYKILDLFCILVLTYIFIISFASLVYCTYKLLSYLGGLGV